MSNNPTDFNRRGKWSVEEELYAEKIISGNLLLLFVSIVIKEHD